jgi:hypothetical protein
MYGSAPRRVAAAAACGLAVAAVMTVGLWLGGSLTAYVNTVLPAQHAYLVWANGGTLWPVALRLAVLSAVAASAMLTAQTAAGKLLAVWVPAAIAGAGLTPRELTHYVHEAVPALAVGVALIAGRLHNRSVASVAGAVAMVVGAELVLIAPAEQTALIDGRRPPAAFLHNFSYADMPAYYANWFAYATGTESRFTYDAWFPGQQSSDRTEVARILASAGERPVHVLVLGDSPWLYIDAGLFPATPFLATNSAFWRVPWAPALVSRDIEMGCADFVIVSDPAGPLPEALAGHGYQTVAGTPWPTYRRVGPASCAGQPFIA